MFLIFKTNGINIHFLQLMIFSIIYFGLEHLTVPIFLKVVDVYLDSSEAECWIYLTSLIPLSGHKS